jgi:hypothetical protein
MRIPKCTRNNPQTMSVPLLKSQSRCPSCGVGVKSGFQMKRHRAACGSRPQERPEHRGTDGEHHDTDGDCECHDTDVAPNVSTAPSTTQTGFICPLDAPLVAHFNAQEESPGLGQCIEWGPRILNPQEEETFRFLQVVDAGSGASGRVAQGMLSCARRLGGNGLLLPRTMRALAGPRSPRSLHDACSQCHDKFKFKISHLI